MSTDIPLMATQGMRDGWAMGRDNESLFMVCRAQEEYIRATAWNDIWDAPKEGNKRRPL